MWLCDNIMRVAIMILHLAFTPNSCKLFFHWVPVILHCAQTPLSLTHGRALALESINQTCSFRGSVPMSMLPHFMACTAFTLTCVKVWMLGCSLCCIGKVHYWDVCGKLRLAGYPVDGAPESAGRNVLSRADPHNTWSGNCVGSVHDISIGYVHKTMSVHLSLNQ